MLFYQQGRILATWLNNSGAGVRSRSIVAGCELRVESLSKILQSRVGRAAPCVIPAQAGIQCFEQRTTTLLKPVVLAMSAR